MISPSSVGVKIYSITGALVADYYSNVENNSGLAVDLSVDKVGGLDKFSFRLSNNFQDPLFNDMECHFFVDGVHWYSGYAEKIPELDSSTAEVVVEGRGFYHKLKDVIVNETYTSQTLDYIVKDIASSYLGADLNVLYDVAKIATPSVTSLTLEFKDKKLIEVFESLLSICNYDFQSAQYTFFVDKDKYLNFVLLPTTNQEVLFEGYHYQDPDVDTKKDKLINKVKAYRTTSADDNSVEYVATYSDTESIENHGEKAIKLTFPDYVNANGLENIADSVIEKYKEPLTKVSIDDLIVDSVKTFGQYRLINKRLTYYKTIAKLESLTDWNITNLVNTTATISTDEVFTNRTSLKLVTAVGSEDDYMELVLDPVLYFPTHFKLYSYRTVSGSQFTIRLIDTFGNTIDIKVGHNNEPLNEWIKYTVQINVELGHVLLWVDRDVSSHELMRVDKDESNFGNLKIDCLIREGILNIYKVQIIVDSDIVGTSYFDQMSVLTSSYKEHRLMLEHIDYELGKAYTASMVFGDSTDSLIDEIVKGNMAGESALSIFSKA